MAIHFVVLVVRGRSQTRTTAGMKHASSRTMISGQLHHQGTVVGPGLCCEGGGAKGSGLEADMASFHQDRKGTSIRRAGPVPPMCRSL